MAPYNYEVEAQDEMADALGELAFALAGARVCRCLWLVRGWPTRMVDIRGNEDLCTATINA